MRTPPVVHLDLADLQGDVLHAYGNDYGSTSYAFVHLDGGVGRSREWFAGLLEHVTTAEAWPVGAKPATTLNVAVTAAGLRALGVGEPAVQSFSREFREGMSSRAVLLGDQGSSRPDTWEAGLGTGQAHVLLTINAREPAGHQRALAKMQAAMEAVGGAHVVHQQDTALLPGAREHFGFADGSSQPAVAGASEERVRGGGVPLARGRWRPLAAGEFVLGYPDEDSGGELDLPPAPAAPLGRSGTYVVWRKLHQDVALWRRVLRRASRHHPRGDEHLLAAKAVGRWPDGTPLVTHPDAPAGGRGRGDNDFRYDGDPAGLRCPLGAHVRRSNPRDALGPDGHLSLRHRIIRRGMPYGEPLREGVLEDDGAHRGLVFVCFQASISRQFEGVQVQWLNDGNIFGLGHDRDFLLGHPAGAGKMTVQGDPPFLLAPQEAFVRTRGGEYLFAPGLTALAALADGTAG